MKIPRFFILRSIIVVVGSAGEFSEWMSDSLKKTSVQETSFILTMPTENIRYFKWRNHVN